MGYGYWTTTAYCGSCEGTVKSDATECPHCGFLFGEVAD